MPFEKLQKKEQRRIYAEQRSGWNGVNPVTKIVPNKKQYNRKRDKAIRSSEWPCHISQFFKLSTQLPAALSSSLRSSSSTLHALQYLRHTHPGGVRAKPVRCYHLPVSSAYCYETSPDLMRCRMREDTMSGSPLTRAPILRLGSLVATDKNRTSGQVEGSSVPGACTKNVRKYMGEDVRVGDA